MFECRTLLSNDFSFHMPIIRDNFFQIQASSRVCKAQSTYTRHAVMTTGLHVKRYKSSPWMLFFQYILRCFFVGENNFKLFLWKIVFPGHNSSDYNYHLLSQGFSRGIFTLSIINVFRESFIKWSLVIKWLALFIMCVLNIIQRY